MQITRRWIRHAIVFLCGCATLVGGDALVGVWYRTDRNARVYVIKPRAAVTDCAIVVFPGYTMPGAILGKAFAPYVPVHDALVVVDYAERGIDVRQIFVEITTALRALKPSRLRIYGASLGGMVATRFLEEYVRHGAPYGKVVLVLDSAPAQQNDVRRPSCLFNLSCWYRGGPLSSAIYATIQMLGPKPTPESSADLELVRAGHHAGAWVGMPAATSQACFIAQFRPLRDRELLRATQQVVFLEGSSSDKDPVIRIPEAIASWQRAAPDLRVVTINSRAGQWHLPLIERPMETVRALTADYPDVRR